MIFLSINKYIIFTGPKHRRVLEKKYYSNTNSAQTFEQLILSKFEELSKEIQELRSQINPKRNVVIQHTPHLQGSYGPPAPQMLPGPPFHPIPHFHPITPPFSAAMLPYPPRDYSSVYSDTNKGFSQTPPPNSSSFLSASSFITNKDISHNENQSVIMKDYLSNIQVQHHCTPIVAKLHLNFHFLLYTMKISMPAENWIIKKDFTFGEFLCALLLRPQILKQIYNIVIKDLNRFLAEHSNALLLFFACHKESNFDLTSVKSILNELFSDSKKNPIRFTETENPNSKELQQQRSRIKFKFISLLQKLLLNLECNTLNIITELSFNKKINLKQVILETTFFFDEESQKNYISRYDKTFKVLRPFIFKKDTLIEKDSKEDYSFILAADIPGEEVIYKTNPKDLNEKTSRKSWEDKLEIATIRIPKINSNIETPLSGTTKTS